MNKTQEKQGELFRKVAIETIKTITLFTGLLIVLLIAIMY